jgi:tRNA-2-methylthio-N6-dimethylallyladenosine synthase
MAPRPGDVVTVTVTRGAPHYLLADGAPLSIRRTRAADAAEQSRAAAHAHGTTQSGVPEPAAAARSAPVLLGMPRHA